MNRGKLWALALLVLSSMVFAKSEANPAKVGGSNAALPFSVEQLKGMEKQFDNFGLVMSDKEKVQFPAKWYKEEDRTIRAVDSASYDKLRALGIKGMQDAVEAFRMKQQGTMTAAQEKQLSLQSAENKKATAAIVDRLPIVGKW